MIFKLFELSWLVLVVACIYGFIEVVKLEDLFIQQKQLVPDWVSRRKWKYVVVMILSTVMLLLIGYLSYRTGKILDGLKIERPYPITRLPAIEKVQHPALPVIQLNLDSGKASWYDYCLPREKGLNLPCSWSRTHATAASTKYKRGDKLDVCVNDGSGRCVMVVVNDYGPAKAVHPDRIIDLSSYAFQQIGRLDQGIIMVDVSLHEKF